MTYVVVRGDLGIALRAFAKGVAPILSEAKRRTHFWPKATRAARKRRGKILEQRRLLTNQRRLAARQEFVTTVAPRQSERR